MISSQDEISRVNNLLDKIVINNQVYLLSIPRRPKLYVAMLHISSTVTAWD